MYNLLTLFLVFDDYGMLSSDNWVCSGLKPDLLSAKEIRSCIVRGPQRGRLRNCRAMTAKSKISEIWQFLGRTCCPKECFSFSLVWVGLFIQRVLSCSLNVLFRAIWFASQLKPPCCESCLVASAGGTWLLAMRAWGIGFSLCSWKGIRLSLFKPCANEASNPS